MGLCATAAVAATHINQCGGGRELLQRVGVACDPGAHAPCTTGVLVCHGTESLVCVPECTTTPSEDPPPLPPLPATVEPVTVEPAAVEPPHACVDQLEFCKQTDCGVGGVCSDLHQRCVCLPGYAGGLCGRRNACEQLDCGQHGVCVHDEMRGTVCRCDEGYSGESCAQRTVCGRGGRWDVRVEQCACKPGYTGEYCAQCDADGLCVPTKRASDPFTLVHAPPPIRQQMLTEDPPPAYTYGPIEPDSTHDGVYYGCGCKARAPEHAADQPLQENFIDLDLYDYGAGSATDVYHRYPHDFYAAYYDHYSYRRNCYAGSSAALVLWILGLAVALLACQPSRRPKTHLPLTNNAPPPALMVTKRRRAAVVTSATSMRGFVGGPGEFDC